MTRNAYHCPHCDVIWTPTAGDRRPIKNTQTLPTRTCPDCDLVPPKDQQP